MYDTSLNIPSRHILYLSFNTMLLQLFSSGKLSQSFKKKWISTYIYILESPVYLGGPNLTPPVRLLWISARMMSHWYFYLCLCTNQPKSLYWMSIWAHISKSLLLLSVFLNGLWYIFLISKFHENIQERWKAMAKWVLD